MDSPIQQRKKRFIAMMLEAMSDIDTGGFFRSVIIAQAAIESNWGRSALSAKFNNYFGIKVGTSWKGKTVNMKTGEVLDGKNVTISSNFRVYDSLADSIRDRNRLLRLPRYREVERADTVLKQVEAIRRAGYCTAKNYVVSIMTTIHVNGLMRYDDEK